jgi:hypothetical protein
MNRRDIVNDFSTVGIADSTEFEIVGHCQKCGFAILDQHSGIYNELKDCWYHKNCWDERITDNRTFR